MPHGDWTPPSTARCHGRSSPGSSPGFTLLELMIVVSILAILASMGIPLYNSAVLNARTAKAKQELRVISTDIDSYRARNQALALPRSLAVVGHGARLDPWGNPYMYLNFQTGTGSGMDFAVENGLVDPLALALGPAPVDPAADAADMLMIPPLPPLEQTRVDQALRRDKFLFPLNTDYDLFSLGPNGMSMPSLIDVLSLDDVIRANDGGYFGLARDY